MAAHSILSLDFPFDDIAVITINDPQKGANVLSRSVLDELEQHLDVLDGRDGLAGLVIRSTKPGQLHRWCRSPRIRCRHRSTG